MLNVEIATLGDFQGMSGHQLSNVREHGLGSSDIAERKILGEGSAVEFCFHAGVGENRLDLGAEKEGVAVPAIVEGLDAESITGGKQGAPLPIPDHKGEHAAQMFHTVAAIFLVKMND